MAAPLFTLTEAHIRFLFQSGILFSLKEKSLASVIRTFAGREVRIANDVVVEPNCAFIGLGPALHTMGAHSYSKAQVKAGWKVGRFCSIASGVQVMPTDHPMTRLSTSGFDYSTSPVYDRYLRERGVEKEKTPFRPGKPVPVIGNDVWLGDGCVIARGVTIGHGAVVAARSIVTRDVAPYSVVAGSPAVHKKYRFDEKLIADLLDIQWWNHDPAAFADLDTLNPERFVGQFRERKAAGRMPVYDPPQIKLASHMRRINKQIAAA